METVVKVRKLRPDLSVDTSVPEAVIAGANAGREGVYLATELSGLVDPVNEAITRAPGGRPGTRLVATRFTERALVFRVTIVGDGGEWFRRESAWRRLWDYGSYSEIEVTTARGSRVLRARLDEFSVDTNLDPAVMGAVDVVMSVVADDPFWYTVSDARGGWTRVAGTTNLVSGATEPHGPIFPEFRVDSGTGTSSGVLSVILNGSKTDLGIPNLLSGSAYRVNTDPGSRQWTSSSDPNVWGRMNGVRYDLGDTSSVRTVSVANTTTRTVFARAAVPYLRPW